MPKVKLQGLRVPGLPEALDRVRVAQEVWIDFLLDAGCPGHQCDDLPGTLALDAEQAPVRLDTLIVSVAFQAMGETVGACHHSGLSALADDKEDGLGPSLAPIMRGVRLKASESAGPFGRERG